MVRELLFMEIFLINQLINEIYYNSANPNDLMNLDNDYYGC